MDFYFLFFYFLLEYFFLKKLFVEKTFFYDYIKMSAINLDTTWVDEYSGDPQTSQIFGKTKTLEEGVKHILKLSGSTQTKLIRMLENVKTKFGKSVIIFNPGVKSYESALRKAQNATGVPNQILRLNDGYRASILSEDIHIIPEILTYLDQLLPAHHFEKMSVLNTFEKPWPNGYRDYNCRLKDLENHGIVGELQIHFCPIKFFSQTVGHLSYEILRTLAPNDPNTENVKKALQTIATAGYNSALEIKDECCFDKINELKQKYEIKEEENEFNLLQSLNSSGLGKKKLWGYKKRKTVYKKRERKGKKETRDKKKNTFKK